MFFFKFTFLSHRFHNEGNHQFIYRTPTRFLTMGLLFTRLWSLFTNEGMWWILRHCVFSWYHFYCKWTCWFLQECVLWRIQDHYSCTLTTCYTNENLVLIHSCARGFIITRALDYPSCLSQFYVIIVLYIEVPVT